MDDGHEHSVESAREAAEGNGIGEWVRAFLTSPGSDNADLGEQLADEVRWWTGPVQLRLDQLKRLAGPPGDPVMEEVEEDEWRDDVDDLACKIEGGFEPPPVIAIYRNGQLELEDGNHRVEALRRADRTEAWGVVGFEDAAARDEFEPPTT